MLKVLAILAMFGTLATAGFVVLRAETPAATENRAAQQNSGSNVQQADAQHEGQNVRVAEIRSTETQEDLKIQRELANYTWWLAAATVLLVVVGAGQVLLLIRQERILHGALNEIHSQAEQMKIHTGILERSVDAAQKSADAAEKSATAAMGVAVPTLMISEFEFAARPDKTMEEILLHPPMTISVKNYGQSPAILKFVAVQYTCGKPPAVADYPPVHPFDIGTVVESAKTLTLPFIAICPWGLFSADEVAAIMAGEKYMTVYGSIWYGDVFGQSMHKLSFCKGLGGFNGEEGGMYWADVAIPDSAVYDPD
jgi:hypothetical protein